MRIQESMLGAAETVCPILLLAESLHHALKFLADDVHVDLRRRQVGMPKRLLCQADVRCLPV